MNLWLDDLRPPPSEGDWHWVKTADEAIDAMLLSPGIEFASLDHDLADLAIEELEDDGQGGLQYRLKENLSLDVSLSHKEKTGYDFVLWMAEHNVWPRDGIRIHSWNAVGGERMCGVVDRYGPYDTVCRHIPDERPWTPLYGPDN